MNKSRPSRTRPSTSVPSKRSSSGRRRSSSPHPQGAPPQKGSRPQGSQEAGSAKNKNQPPRHERRSHPEPRKGSPHAKNEGSAPQKSSAREHPASPPPLPGAHWRETLGPLLSHSNYQPLAEADLIRKLNIPQSETQAFLQFLAEQELTGRTMRDPRGRLVSPKKLGYSVGHLQMNERGFGFLVSSDPAEPDFYIAGDDTAHALHGDLVVARLKKGGREGRLRGEVVRLLQRKRRHLVGVLCKTPQFYYVRPDETRIPYDIRVPAPAQAATLGQKVVIELGDWSDRGAIPTGKIIEVLGAPDAPGVDLLSIVRKYDLPTSFPQPVEQEAADISALIAPAEIARREDFRRIITLTIDPDDAKDFDDALSYRTHPDGSFDIYVHIADVSHYVRVGSPLDVEARARGNSVYLVDRVIPMLPEKLSNGICSLQPNVDRLVKTAIVTLDPRGEIRNFRFAEGVIHSQKRFTYQEAFGLIRQPPVTPLAHDLHALNAMAQVLRKRRFARGALDLDMGEIKVRLDAHGTPVRLEKMENDLSHQLVEEFMLLANEVVALELKRRDRPGLYRIHENPDPGRLAEFRAQAKSMGFPCGDLTQKGEIQKLLDRAKGQPGEEVIKIGLLKSLKRAMYSPKPLGHFGLSKINYTHFTSPIRRYSDLVVHRVLFGVDRAAGSYDNLARLALHLSTSERTASEAEQESVKLKKLEYFDLQARSKTRASFQALVLEVRASGLLVQLPEFQVQGLVPLASGDFVFNAQRLELHDRRGNRTFRAGQSLTVEVAAVDLARNQIDFRLTPASPGNPPARRAVHGR
jgi:ribonuclease R